MRHIGILIGLVMALTLIFPALAAGGDVSVGPLGEADIARYQTIFTAQEKGDWKKADVEIAALENKILLGYVLEQRYMHPTAYRSSYPELSRWMTAYADHPHAAPVYRLAKRRQGSANPPRRPSLRRWRTNIDEANMHPEMARDYAESPRRHDVPSIERRLRYLTAKGRSQQALNYLNDPRQFNALTAAQTDRVRGWIAASFYYEGELRKAENVAELALRRSTDHAVMSHWITGLIAYRRDDFEAAYSHFSQQADIPYQEDTFRSAAAFWAARSAVAAGSPEKVTSYLELASDYPLTFYGQLALAQLGQASGLQWTAPTLTEETYQELTQLSPRVERAAALAQVGLTAEADNEIKYLHGEVSADHDMALAALAHDLALPSAQMHIAAYARTDEAAHNLTAGLYPLPDYKPTGGFEVDRAVLFGLIRQESKFMPEAESRVGARGLMQLMPRTASYVASKEDMRATHASGRLYDPGYNMQLGQSYVQQLLTNYNGGSGDLFEMALSYNWGPGNFSRWKARNPIDDQLLMLESVPNAEARHFVEQVLTNIWVYRDRLGEPAPSRDQVAAGLNPLYQSVAADTVRQ